MRRVASRERGLELAGADRIDEHSVPAHEVEDGEIRARLLCVANDIKVAQVVYAIDDRGGVINEGGRSELARQVADGDPGNFVTQGGEAVCCGRWHGLLAKKVN